jgi:hypothetical protein
LNEIWGSIGRKELSSSAKAIYAELQHGFDWQGSPVDGLPKALDETFRLPEFDENGSLIWAGEYIQEKNADIQALINTIWDEKVSQVGDGYVCGPDEIKEIFEAVLCLRDPDESSGIKVILEEHSNNLSWDSANLTIRIGVNRGPIKSRDDMFRKVLHEFGVHGQRAINGLKTDLPILSTGLFTDTERADYLTFEEGLATTIEEGTRNKKPNWDAPKLGLYINIALAQKGHDFREVFELSWRYRVLMKIKPNEEVDDDFIEKQKSLAYNSAVRVFRGTQPDLFDKIDLIGAPLTYNKDLAYLNGRILAMNYINEVFKFKDSAKLDKLFLAKYDPTIVEQDKIVESYLVQ